MSLKRFILFGITAGGLILLTAEAPAPRGDARSGKAVYDRYCASCHGKRGEGMGASLKMSNFSAPQYQESRTDQELYDRISKGGEGTGMPAWNKKLSQQDHWNLVAYIRTLAVK